jgi:hypothetical protein
MSKRKRVTIISTRIFVLISVVYLAIAALSTLKYFSKYDPYYPLQSAAYVGIWLLWLYIYLRGRKSVQRVAALTLNDRVQKAKG